MKELRTQHKGRLLRILFAFDPRRCAILLIGGDKTGDGRFYERMIPLADRLVRRASRCTAKGRVDLMARTFRELEAKMPPKSLTRAKVRAKEMMAEMLLAEIRKAVGLTQEQVAISLGIKQPTLSRLESQDDMQISTLRRLIHALGGELEIIARLPGGEIRLTQFDDVA